jgi:hypothetical protein
MAMHFALAFRAYLRPGESDTLQVKSLVPPVALAGPQFTRWGLNLHAIEDLAPGKTGIFDEAILLDDIICLQLGDSFAVLTAGGLGDSPLWPTAAPTHRKHSAKPRRLWSYGRPDPVATGYDTEVSARISFAKYGHMGRPKREAVGPTIEA